MGNCFGKPSKRPLQNGASPARPTRQNDINDPAAGQDGAEPRIISCEESIHVDVGQLRIRYGYMSQRGYYPDGEFDCSPRVKFLHRLFLTIFVTH